MTGIERFRRKKLLTQGQLASLLGVSATSVSYWEMGKTMPRVEVLKQMSALLDVTVDELLRNDYPETDVVLPMGEEAETCSPASS